MDAFIIHSSKDAGAVTERLSYIKKQMFGFNPLMLKSKNKLWSKLTWRFEASAKIKKAQIVVFFVGEKSHGSKFIGYEIKKAKQLKKPIYTVYLDDSYKPHPELFEADPFSKELRGVDTKKTAEELALFLKSHEETDYDVFNQSVESMDTKLLFEQYRLFLQTSESLVSRRQTVNSFYITVNSAFVALFGTLFGIGVDIKFKMILATILAAVGIVLAVSWMKILISYGQLNAGKMAIIRSIEKKLPASLYDAEWKALSDQLNNKKYVSFTNSEKRLPVMFIAIYICVLLAFATLFSLNLFGIL